MDKINTFSGLNEHKSIIFENSFMEISKIKLKKLKIKKTYYYLLFIEEKTLKVLILKMMKQEWLFVLVFLIQIYQI